jgi:O-methyltransferase involved in polyketide biosynthesis
MKEGKASQTAEGTAAVRARESMKSPEERICYDPFARYFLSPKYLLLGFIKPLGKFIRWRNEKILPGMFGGVVARTRYIEYVLEWLQVLMNVRKFQYHRLAHNPFYLNQSQAFQVESPLQQQ